MGGKREPSSRSAGRIKAQWSRMARTGQVISSFFAVLGVYLVYWLLAVPLIEPGIEPAAVARASEGTFS